MFTDNAGNVCLSAQHTRLVKVITSAVREESSENNVASKVCSTFRGQCTRNTVRYVLNSLEMNSVVYSYLDGSQCKCYCLLEK